MNLTVHTGAATTATGDVGIMSGTHDIGAGTFLPEAEYFSTNSKNEAIVTKFSDT